VKKIVTVIINKEEYIKTFENGNIVLTQPKNKRGFKVKVTLSGNEQDVEDFKLFVINLISKKYWGVELDKGDKKIENYIDFLFSKSFLETFLKDKIITQDEYAKCIKDLKLIYLTEG